MIHKVCVVYIQPPTKDQKPKMAPTNNHGAEDSAATVRDQAKHVQHDISDTLGYVFFLLSRKTSGRLG